MGKGLISRLSHMRLKEGARSVVPILRRIPSMSFSFYAEDVLLPHMRPQSSGFYVDVGAFHPRVHSNTYKLYLKGWSGVTVEPNPDVAATFRSVRPRDQHLTIGIAEQGTSLICHKFRDAALNTFDAARANVVQSEKVGEITVTCLTLNDLFAQYCRGHHVDLLNVDCEGRDLDVIESLDWERHRPTVVIVEDFEQFEAGAHAVPRFSAIRSFMLAQDYALASQAIFSFFYVDRRAFGRSDPDSGFRLDQSQLGLLASN
jgi:FkbM family methyltransferase